MIQSAGTIFTVADFALALNAEFRGRVISDGVVSMSSIFKGELPEGFGSQIIAQVLKASDALPTKQLIIKGIVNTETLTAYRAGVAAENTLMARCAAKALKSLGIEPISFQYDNSLGPLNIIIKTGE